ncbi:MAG: hypothetical protein ACLP50_12435 [Solirubrobacteraceae bacterium]
MRELRRLSAVALLAQFALQLLALAASVLLDTLNTLKRGLRTDVGLLGAALGASDLLLGTLHLCARLLAILLSPFAGSLRVAGVRERLLTITLGLLGTHDRQVPLPKRLLGAALRLLSQRGRLCGGRFRGRLRGRRGLLTRDRVLRLTLRVLCTRVGFASARISPVGWRVVRAMPPAGSALSSSAPRAARPPASIPYTTRSAQERSRQRGPSAPAVSRGTQPQTSGS